MTNLRLDKKTAIERVRQLKLKWLVLSKINTYKDLRMIWSITGKNEDNFSYKVKSFTVVQIKSESTQCIKKMIKLSYHDLHPNSNSYIWKRRRGY